MPLLRALVVLVVLALALPQSARADTGWGLELAARGRARAAEAPVATIASAPPGRPLGMLAGTAGGSAVQAPSGAGARALRARVVLDDTPPDHSFPVRAARSRQRATQRDFLALAPSRALATRGIVGFHTAPAPPHA